MQAIRIRTAAALMLAVLFAFEAPRAAAQAAPLESQAAALAPLPAAGEFDPSYAAWNRVLARCARPEGFLYDQLMPDLSDFDAQLIQFGAVAPEQFENWSREARLAFLINAHNAYAVARVLAHYRPRTIESTRFFGSALKHKNIFVLGKRWSLASLREEIMGPRYRDCRAIFLLNWASSGCAPLAETAATERNLPDLLEIQTRAFIRDPRFNSYDRKGIRFDASPLLREYREDIERDYTTLWKFIERYGRPEDVPHIEARPPKFNFLEFDEKLNEGPRAKPEPALPEPAPEAAPGTE